MDTINVNGKIYKEAINLSKTSSNYVLFEGSWYEPVEVKRDWQVLELQTEAGKITMPDLIEGLLGSEYVTITKVKRLSDGEVFEVGDKISFTEQLNEVEIEICFFSINGKEIFANRPYSSSNSLRIKNWVKLPRKVLLFTTVDGKDIYEGDEFYINDNERNRINLRKGGDGLAYEIEEVRSRCYSTKEAAMFGIPCLSLNDIIDCYKEYDSDFKEEEHNRFPVYPIIKKLAEQKINN